MKKAIFFDIDGTLIDCLRGLTDITPRVKKCIRKLQNEGNYIFIGSPIVIFVPISGLLSTTIDPLCMPIIHLAIDKPRPVPPLSFDLDLSHL